LKGTEISIVRAAITEKAAGQVADEAKNFCGAGLGRDVAMTERLLLKEGERVAWKQHQKAAAEATRNFLRRAGG
jgi:hypothetical protein